MILHKTFIWFHHSEIKYSFLFEKLLVVKNSFVTFLFISNLRYFFWIFELNIGRDFTIVKIVVYLEVGRTTLEESRVVIKVVKKVILYIDIIKKQF